MRRKAGRIWTRTAFAGSPDSVQLPEIRPEGDLLLACLRARWDPTIAGSLAERLELDIDWTRFVRATLRHEVTPLVHDALERVGHRVPDEILDALRVHVAENRQRASGLLGALLHLLETLTRGGIPAISVQGPALAHLAYGDLSLRRAGVLEVLVHRKHVLGARDVLERLGYGESHQWADEKPLEAMRGSAPHHAWRRRLVRASDMCAVDLQWAFAAPGRVIRLDYPAIWERARPLALNGGTVASLDPRDLLLAVCVHGAHRRWAQLGWLADVAGLVSRHPTVDWSAALCTARRQGCERMVVLGLTLADLLVGAALAPELRHRLHGDRVARSLAARIALDLSGGEPAPSSAARSRSFRVHLRERLRDKLETVVRSLAVREVEPVAEPLKTELHSQSVRRAWSERVETWSRWANAAPDRSDDLSAQLLDIARVTGDQRVLDLASGVGEPALAIARRTGPAGLVVATDVVPGMLAAVRRRADAAGLESIRCCAADMQALPYRDRSFDRVLCRLGIMFCSRVEPVLAEAHRVLAPEGSAAFLVWGPIEDNTLFEVMVRVFATVAGDLSGTPGWPLFRFAARGHLSREMRQAGFTQVAEHDVRTRRAMPEEPRFWHPQFERTFGSLIADLPEATRCELEAAVDEELQTHRRRRGGDLLAHARVVVGIRP